MRSPISSRGITARSIFGIAVAIAAFWLSPPQIVNAQSVTASTGISLHAAADDGAPVIGTLARGEKLVPIAETYGVGGVKWYLVKTPTGVFGWLRHSDNEPSKAAENFFRGLPAEPSGIPLDTKTNSAETKPRGAATIPVSVHGGSIIVPVIFNRSVDANLLLDTGASMTMISRRLATTLALPATGAGLFSGIGGTVSAPIARVQSIKVGDAEVSGLAVSIHDVSRFQRFDGLLGMDFLGRFQVSVDSAKKLLVLTPK